ncbi:MAG: hypothetical protein RSC84_01005 [Peptostreptococcaceae bacterium]
MKLYSVLITSIFISGFLIIGCASSTDTSNEYKEKNIKEVAYENTKKKLSEEEAINLVKEYLQREKLYIPNFIEVDSISGDVYTIHIYDVIKNEDESHIATSGWFEVNMYTGKITNIMNE